MSKKTQQVTGQKLNEVRSGLAVLKEKRLPSIEAEMLVASMWQMLRPAFDLYDDLVRKVQHEAQAAELEEGEMKLAAKKAVQEKAQALPTMQFMVTVPKTKIQQQHLPKTHKGKDGEENPTGNAGVIIALGPEFFEFPAEPDE